MLKLGQFFRILNILLLIGFWVYTIVSFFQLPEVIPIHFDLNGNADGFGNRNMQWFEGGVVTLLFIILQYASKNPYMKGLNIPNTMRENAPLTFLFCQVLCFLMMLLFTDLTYNTVEVALQRKNGTGYSSLYFLVLIFISMIGFIYYAYKNPLKKN